MKKNLLTIFLIFIFLFSKANDIVLDSLKNQLKIANKIEKIDILIQISKIYVDSLPIYAIKYTEDAIDIAKKENIKEEKFAQLYNILGEAHFYRKDYKRASKYFKKELKILEKTASKEKIMYASFNLASTYKKINNLRKSIEFYLKSLKIAEELNLKNVVLHNYNLLYQAYLERKNYKNGYLFYQNYIILRDSIFNNTISDRLEILKKERLKTKKEIEKKKKILYKKDAIIKKTKSNLEEKELELEQVVQKKEELKIDSLEKALQINSLSKEKEEQKLEIKESKKEIEEQKILIYFFIIVSIIILGFLVWIFRLNNLKNKANEKLEHQKKEILKQSTILENRNIEIVKKNKQIIESINYAKRIQTSILVPELNIQKALPNIFILYKPKDIVSGDFYWFTEIDNKLIVSAIDCTGHGVPGAFMSMIGDSLLYQIVKDKKITEADKILNHLHKGIRNALNQEETKNQDGMDMALCVIDKKSKKIEFAGAKNPLIYIQNGELLQIKGDKRSIGGKQKEEERIFKKHEVDVSKETMLYIFSDGYQDQFGGDKNRKFMIKRMKELLLQVHHKDLKEQKRILNLTIEQWMKDTKQLDDILLIGIKI